MNVRQKELVKEFCDEIEQKYPDTSFQIVEHKNGAISIKALGPWERDSDEELQLLERMASKTVEVFMSEGYHICVLPYLRGISLQEKKLAKEFCDEIEQQYPGTTFKVSKDEHGYIRIRAFGSWEEDSDEEFELMDKMASKTTDLLVKGKPYIHVITYGQKQSTQKTVG